MKPAVLPDDPAPTVAAQRTYDAALKAWKDVNNQAAELIYSMCEEKPVEAIEEEDEAYAR